MDQRFFMDAMSHVGLNPVVIDENTDFTKLDILGVSEPIAAHRHDCALCKLSIHRGDKHKKWVYHDGGFKSIRFHLECRP